MIAPSHFVKSFDIAPAAAGIVAVLLVLVIVGPGDCWACD
jgi:hypothetical protein